MPMLINSKYSNYLGALDVDLENELSCYYDFNLDEIVNKDESTADFMVKYPSNMPFDDKVVNLIKYISNNNDKKSLSKLNFFKVKNNVFKINWVIITFRFMSN